MTSQIDIYNLALALLGSPRASSLTENSRAVVALNSTYDIIRQGELRKRPCWNFAVTMIELSANTIPPVFGRANAYQLPGDFLAMAEPLPEMDWWDLDWQIQGNQIISRFDAPIKVRYVSNITNVGQMDPLFCQALAAKLAEVNAFAITQSKSQVQAMSAVYQLAISDASRANAYDNVPRRLPIDPWITVRF